MRNLLYTCLFFLLCLSFSNIQAQTQVWVQADPCDCNPTVSCLCEPGPWIPLPCPAPCESFGTQTFYRVYPSTYEFVHPVLGVLSGTCPPPPPGGAVMFQPCYNPAPCGPLDRAIPDPEPEPEPEPVSCVESGTPDCIDLNISLPMGYSYDVPISQVYSGMCPVSLSQSTFTCDDEGLNTISILDEAGITVCMIDVTVACLNGFPCLGSCQASINPILPPATVETTLTSHTFSICDDGGWTYYRHPNIPGKYLFGINWAPDGSISSLNQTAKNNATVTINVLGSYHEVSDANSGSFIMGRYWNVDNAGTFDEPVDFRFFYDPSEVSNTTGAATAYANSIGEDEVAFGWFKQNSNFDPMTDNSADFLPDLILHPTETTSVDGVSYVEFSGVTSFSGGGFMAGTAALLPVELTYFDGIAFEDYVRLNWETASELSNEKFEIEASIDGINFRKVGEVKGKGTTTDPQYYSFNVDKPQPGISYYRLKQVDFDGRFEYSDVISVNFESKGERIGEFYPNPSKSGNVSINYFSPNDDEISVAVFDVTGKLVINQIQQVFNGTNNLSFDFSALNTGIYIVRIGDENNPSFRKLILK